MIDDAAIVQHLTRAMLLVLMLSLPVVGAAALTGVLVGLLQAVTQIQDQTLSFAIRLVAAIGAMLLSARWVGGELLAFTQVMLSTATGLP
ncbi:MAG: type III secretion system export apparatus subunit SctS [Pseudomonadota bacterium]